MKTLLEGGAASQAELEQAQTALATSEAQLQAIEAQIREQKVDLAYHRVSAPVAGIVGDVPVRVGDSVTKSTVLTTIDQNAGLEVYVNVPVQEAPKLKVGLPVHIVDERGQLAGRRDAVVRVPFGRPRDPVGAGQDRPRADRRRPHRAVRPRPDRLDDEPPR